MRRISTYGQSFMVLVLATAAIGCANILGGDDGNSSDNQDQSGDAILSIENNMQFDIEVHAGSYSMGTPSNSSEIRDPVLVTAENTSSEKKLSSESPFNIWYTYQKPTEPGTTGYVRLVQAKEGLLSVFALEAGAEYALRLGLPDGKYEFYRTDGTSPKQAAGPAISPGSGTYEAAQTITISSATQDAVIYYTLNGTTPTENSQEYSDPIIVDSTVTVSAIATAEGFADSDVVHATLEIDPVDPEFDNQTPEITSFTAPASVTQAQVWFYELQGIDDTGIAAWQITESAAQPSPSDPEWRSFRPASYMLPGTGTYTLYAWAQDSAGNVSASKSVTVEYGTDTQPLLAFVDNYVSTAGTTGLARDMDSWVSDVSVDGSTIIVGYGFNDTAVISVSTDGGVTWSDYSASDGLPRDTSPSDVFVDGGTLYVSWSASDDDPALAVSSDGGTSWETYGGIDPASREKLTALYVDQGAIFAGMHGGDGNEGGVSISENGGTSWTNYNTSNSALLSNDVRELHYDAPNLYVATGSGLSVLNTDTDAWTNYTEAEGLADYMVEDVYASGSQIYLTTFIGGLQWSLDSGFTWESSTRENDSSKGVYFDGSSIYTIDNSGLHASADGVNWQTYRIEEGLGSLTTNEVVTEGTSVYVATRPNSGDPGGLTVFERSSDQ